LYLYEKKKCIFKSQLKYNYYYGVAVVVGVGVVVVVVVARLFFKI